MNIIVTGYNGSGSSTICKLLGEYDSIKINEFNYEHVLLYSPDGIMDLEKNILNANTILSSDVAIHRFNKLMDKLYYTDYGWTGGYKKLFGKKFKELYKNYICSLVDIRFEGTWFGKNNKYSFSFFETIKDLIKYSLGKEYINFGKKIKQDNEEILLADCIMKLSTFGK